MPAITALTAQHTNCYYNQEAKGSHVANIDCKLSLRNDYDEELEKSLHHMLI